MSFLTGKIDNIETPKPKTLGLDESRASSNEQARSVPFFTGHHRIPLIWISDLYNVYTQEVSTNSGGKFGGGNTQKRHTYLVSVAGLIGIGPIDKIFRIFVDDEVVWGGNIVRGSEDFVDISVTGRGAFRLYWGTDTQSADIDLNFFGAAHTAYRGFAYARMQLWNIGEQTSIGNIEVEVVRTPSAYTWFTNPVNMYDNVNPMVAGIDFLQHKRGGLGLPTSAIDTASFNAAGATLQSEDISVCSSITKPTPGREAFIELGSYTDCYLKEQADGKIAVGLIRDPGSIGALPVINETMMLNELELDPGSWADTLSEIHIKYKDQDRIFKEDSFPFRDAANFRITGEFKSKTFERSWVTRRGVAQKLAIATGRKAAIPQCRFPLSVTRSGAGSLGPGSAFVLNYAFESISGLVCRVIEKTIPGPAAQRVDFECEVDFGYLNQRDFLDADDAIPAGTTWAAVADLFERIIELPFALTPAVVTEGTATLSMLIGRGNGITVGFFTHFEQIYGGVSTFKNIGTHRSFVRWGTLAAQYISGTQIIDTMTGVLLNVSGTDTTMPSPNIDDALENDWMLFIDDEIIAPSQIVVVAANQYRIYGIRARYDTARAIHANGSSWCLIRRDDLQRLRHPSFNLGRTHKFKIQPFIHSGALDLAGIAVTNYTVSMRSLRPIPPSNLRVNNDGYNPTYGSGSPVPVSWSITSERGGEFWSLFANPYTASIPKTVLEFWTIGGVLKATVEVDAGLASYSWPSLSLRAAFGLESNLIVRAYAKRGPLRSNNYESLLVVFQDISEEFDYALGAAPTINAGIGWSGAAVVYNRGAVALEEFEYAIGATPTINAGTGWSGAAVVYNRGAAAVEEFDYAIGPTPTINAGTGWSGDAVIYAR